MWQFSYPVRTSHRGPVNVGQACTDGRRGDILANMKSRRFARIIVFVGLAQSSLAAQEPLSDRFSSDPTLGGWVLRGSTLWVAPSQSACADVISANSPDRRDPCSLYPASVVEALGETVDDFGGYLLLTNGRREDTGTAFSPERVLYEHLRTDLVFEMRDGYANGERQDGGRLQVIFLGTPDVPNETQPVSAFRFAPAPTLVFEIDNRYRERRPAELRLYWAKDGFRLDKPIVPAGSAELPGLLGDPRLNNGELHPASPNRFQLSLFLQTEDDGRGATVACSLTALDAGVDLGRLYRVELPEFVPFEGYLGIVGITGNGEFQNQLLHSVEISDDVPCLIPPADVVRSVEAPRSPEVYCAGHYLPGDTVDAELTIDSLRETKMPCVEISTTLEIVETPPAGWEVIPESITAGGLFEPNAGEIHWSVADPVPGTMLRYSLVARDETRVEFHGTVFRTGAADDLGEVRGVLALRRGATPEECTSGFIENFANDPRENGWRLHHHARWVPPDAAACIDSNFLDLASPCTLYPPDVVGTLIDRPAPQDFGYVVVAASSPHQSGNIFQTRPQRFSDFELTVVVELRDGNPSWSGDGLAVVLVGGDEPPSRLGTGGGGMGAPCVGSTPDAPEIVLEFDNDWSNGGDQLNGNHIAFAYSADGFSCFDSIQPHVFVPIDPEVFRLHNRELHPATPNRLQARLTIFQGVAYCQLYATDERVDLGRVFEYPIPDFRPFVGYVGATAGTGGVWQNHLLHSIALRHFDRDTLCYEAPLQIVRRFRGVDLAPDPATTCGGSFSDGDTVGVELRVESVRPAAGHCERPERVRISDTPPEGWPVVQMSPEGHYDGERVTWTIEGPSISVGQTLSYTVTASADRRTVEFKGTSREIGEDGLPLHFLPVVNHGENNTLTAERWFGECGAIHCWNFLGPFALPETSDGLREEDLREDYLTDGAITERTFYWAPGERIGSQSALIPTSSDLNPEGVPTVHPYHDDFGIIDLENDVLGSDVDRAMVYAQAYLTNTTDSTITLHGIGFLSDSPVQVLLDGEEILLTLGSTSDQQMVCRARDRTREVVLEPGDERSLVFKLYTTGERLQLGANLAPVFGVPRTEGIRVSKLSIRPPPGGRFVRGDANSDADVNISDPVAIFGLLFLGHARPSCLAAADADGNGQRELSDGIYLLNFLFLNGPMPPPPFPICARALDTPADECIDTCP